MDKRTDDAKARRVGVGVGVGGRLRQRLSQILLHSSCTTTSATAFVSLSKNNAVPGNAAAGSRQGQPPAAAHEPPRTKIDGSVRRRRRRSSRALVHISVECSGATSARHSARSVGAAAVMPSPVAPAKGVKDVGSKARGGKPRSLSYSCSSSTDTDDELPPFSSDGEGDEGAETRSSTLFSSLSISSDSTSDFYNSTGGSKRHHHSKNPPRRTPPRGAKPANAMASKQHDGKGAKKADGAKHGGVAAAGSMAVVKRSHNPYADFRSSMVEMVVERRVCSPDAMGDLLVSYLSLNSRRHHPAILAAFEDVWEAVFAAP
uniref:Transcription repressor n=1 Tax=Oryza brachyantha TaxID=4533 RepID=J3MA56_ORYBR